MCCAVCMTDDALEVGRALDALGPESQTVVSHWLGAGTEPRSLARATVLLTAEP